MGYIKKNTLVFNSGLRIPAQLPVDDRLRIENFSDIFIDAAHPENCCLYGEAYTGMIVAAMDGSEWNGANAKPHLLICKDDSAYKVGAAKTVNLTNYESVWHVVTLDQEHNIEDVSARVETLESYLNISGTGSQGGLPQTINRLDSSIRILNSSVSSLESYVNTTLKNKLTSVDSSIATNAADISSLKAQLGGASGSTISDISTKLTNVSTRLNDTSVRVYDVSSRLNNVSTRLASTNESLNSLANTVNNNLQQTVTQIQQEMTDSDSSIINYVNTQDNDISTRVYDVSIGVNNLLSEMSELFYIRDERITRIDSSIKDLWNEFDVNSSVWAYNIINFNSSILEFRADNASFGSRLNSSLNSFDSSIKQAYEYYDTREEVLATAFNRLVDELIIKNVLESNFTKINVPSGTNP